VTEGKKEEEKTICKVLGITLNYNASKLVNFERIRDMILRTGDDIVNVHTDRKIKRKRRISRDSHGTRRQNLQNFIFQETTVR